MLPGRHGIQRWLSSLAARLSYANVIATMALFVALGGTGYAALKLPRDSVGTRELRSGAVGHAELRRDAVTGTDVRDGSLTQRDFSAATRSALVGPVGARGAAGPQGDVGPQGPAGLPGASSITSWAVINGDGARVSGTATSADTIGPGDYKVTFARWNGACAAVATLARVPADSVTDVPAGRVTVEADADGVRVRTYDVSGDPQDIGFHLIVVC
jgi:hypothetical protein